MSNKWNYAELSKFAKKCGHTITPLSPALVPFSIEEEWCYSLQGLSLKNVQAQVELNGKTIYSDFGEMLFTHYGVSGPLMLSASSYYVHQVTKAGKKDDENLNFGGLLGYGPIMKISKVKPNIFVNRGGQIPAPLNSLKN